MCNISFFSCGFSDISNNHQGEIQEGTIRTARGGDNEAISCTILQCELTKMLPSYAWALAWKRSSNNYI